MILCAAAPTFSGYVGNRGFFIVVALLALVVTTFILLMAMLNIQAVCIPERWPLMVSNRHDVWQRRVMEFSSLGNDRVHRACRAVSHRGYFGDRDRQI